MGPWTHNVKAPWTHNVKAPWTPNVTVPETHDVAGDLRDEMRGVVQMNCLLIEPSCLSPLASRPSAER
jgi:hypothetical protein